MIARRALLLAGAALAAAPGARAAEEKKKGGGESYIQFPTLSATVARPGGGRGVLTAEAGVDTPDPALRSRVEKLIPRLQDAYASAMAACAGGLAPGAPPDVELMVQRLQAATDRVVGRPGARFLIGTVIVE